MKRGALLTALVGVLLAGSVLPASAHCHGGWGNGGWGGYGGGYNPYYSGYRPSFLRYLVNGNPGIYGNGGYGGCGYGGWGNGGWGGWGNPGRHLGWYKHHHHCW